MPEAYNKGATVTAKKLLTLVATYKAHISIQLMLDHVILGSFLGHVGGGKWPQDEAKTMPCTMYFTTLIMITLQSIPSHCSILFGMPSLHLFTFLCYTKPLKQLKHA